MKRIIKFILPVLFGCVLFSGCNKWLDVQPSDQISDQNLFADPIGFRNALNGIYQQASGKNLYGRELTWGLASTLGQDYTSTTIPTEYQQAALNNFTHSSVLPVSSAIWSTAYNTIANCNKLIAETALKDPSFFPLKATEKDLILGEALAMRALLHFELLRLFAPAPLSDRTGRYMPYQVSYPSKFSAPLPTTEIINNVVADLSKAQSLVANNDTLVNRAAMSNKLTSMLTGGGAPNGGVFFNFRMNRLNFVAIHALLARVYLYNSDRINAKKEAEYVYKNYSPTGKNKWWAFTTEANSKGINLYPKLADDIIMAFYDPNLITSIKDYKKTSFTFALAETGSLFPATERDYRLNIINPDLVSSKWLESTSIVTVATRQNLIMPAIRFSEIYYIYSECLFEDGQTEDALRVLNEVRLGRGKTTTFSDNSREGFYNELFKEYRKDFIAEGQTVFAHKRLNRNMLIGTKVIEMNGKFVLPLPEGETIF